MWASGMVITCLNSGLGLANDRKVVRANRSAKRMTLVYHMNSGNLIHVSEIIKGNQFCWFVSEDVGFQQFSKSFLLS